MRHRPTTVLALLLAVSAGPVLAQQAPPVTLKVGDAAPPLTTGKWVKGEPVAQIEAGKVYVVEFWATWCGPCRDAMPHVTKLAKQYPDVVFIGQNVMEEDTAAVKPFLDKMGDKVGYRIALDDVSKTPDGAMAAGWMTAAGKNSIPTTFIIDKQSKVAWIGHPMEMDAVLEKVVKGTYDAKAAAAETEKVGAIEARINAAAKARDVDAILAATKELAALKPEMADQIAAFEFNVLARSGRLDDARPRAERVAQSAKNPGTLNMVAWTIASQPTPAAADVKIARQAIDRAVELTAGKEPNLLDTSARLYAAEKDWKQAVECQQKAVALADGEAKTAMQKALDAYQKQQMPAAE